MNKMASGYKFDYQELFNQSPHFPDELIIITS